MWGAPVAVLCSAAPEPGWALGSAQPGQPSCSCQDPAPAQGGKAKHAQAKILSSQGSAIPLNGVDFEGGEKEKCSPGNTEHLRKRCKEGLVKTTLT